MLGTQETYLKLLDLLPDKEDEELKEFVGKCRKLGVDEEEVRVWTEKSLRCGYDVLDDAQIKHIFALRSKFIEARK